MLFVMLGLGAQPPELQSFEVASVRLRTGPVNASTDITISGRGIRITGRTLRGLLAYAYDLGNDQLSVSEKDPAAGDNVYEIVAKAEGDVARTEAEFREMMRALLADRFKLKAHFEPRERPVYRLVVDKGGLKLKEVESDDPQSHHGVNGRNQTLQLKGHLDVFTEALQSFVDRPIVNATGLTKTYDIRFEATPMFTMNRNQEFADLDAFTALRQQLGLRLESAKEMMQVLVVDHVEKPSEN
jgi:uncharacterized protein (TIGR03435 family)